MIRDRLVCGIVNEKWTQRLLAEENKLTCDKAYSLLLSLEASEKQVKVLAQPGITPVHQLRPSRPSSTPFSANHGRAPSRKPSSKDTRPCYRCGGEHNADKCRFKTAECRYCHKKGHIASACRKKQRASQGTATHSVAEQGDNSVDEYTLPIDCVTSARAHLRPLMVTVTIQDILVPMEVDTGATVSLMSHSTFSRLLPEAKLKPSAAKLHTYTGEEIRVKGVVEVKVKYGHQTKDLTLTVVDGDGPTLLGRDWLQHLKLNWSTLNHVSQDERSELKSMLDTHSALFSEGLEQISSPPLEGGESTEVLPSPPSTVCTTRQGGKRDRQTDCTRYPRACQVLPLGNTSRTHPQEGRLHPALR